MESREGLQVIALLCLITPFIMSYAIPEPQVYHLFEASLFSRFMFVNGLALAAFFLGLSLEEDVPLILGIICLAISIFWIKDVFPDTFAPYIYSPSPTLKGWRSITMAIWFLGSALSFIGTGMLVKRGISEVRGLEPSTRNEK